MILQLINKIERDQQENAPTWEIKKLSYEKENNP